MADANSTGPQRPSLDSPALVARAQNEFSAARDAFQRANALLAVIKHAAATDQMDAFSALLLIDTAIELTEVYGERAEDEADFFAEVQHG